MVQKRIKLPKMRFSTTPSTVLSSGLSPGSTIGSNLNSSPIGSNLNSSNLNSSPIGSNLNSSPSEEFPNLIDNPGSIPNPNQTSTIQNSEPQWKQWKPPVHVTGNYRWRRFKQYINYKPSLAYFVVGLMGVLLIEAHLQAIVYADQLFVEFVNTEFRNLVRKAGIRWNTAVNVIFNEYYIDYANAILDLDKDIDSFLDETRNALLDVLSTIDTYETDIKDFIGSYLGSFISDLFFSILDCFTPLFEIPNAMNTVALYWPTTVDLPIIPPPTFLMLNFSKFDLGVDRAKEEIDVFATDYEQSISADLNFFIFLLCWGCGVPLFGIISTIYFWLRDRGYCISCTRHYYKAETTFRRKFLRKYRGGQTRA